MQHYHLLNQLATVSITRHIPTGNTCGLHKLPGECDTLGTSHDRGASLPPNFRGQALILQPVLNKLLLHRAGSAVGHNLEKGSHLPPAKTVGQLGERVLRVGFLGGCQAAHSRPGDLLDSDQVGIKVGEGLGPDGLIERVRVGKECIGAAQGNIMFEDIVATKVSQIEAACERVLGAGLNGLREKKNSICAFNVVTVEHAVGKYLEVNILAVARDVAMVGQGVEPGAGTTSFVKRLALITRTSVFQGNTQAPGDGAIHS
jgi:hypothetical protein